MSERERWIIYPLLFLALGAALRDKLINSTESQRVKCQGLMVYDSSGDVSMVLGAEQFPDVRQQTVRSQLKLDAIEVAKLRVTDSVSFERIEHAPREGMRVSISGANVIRLLAWLDQFQQYFTKVQQRAQELRERQLQLAPPASSPRTQTSPNPPANPDEPTAGTPGEGSADNPQPPAEQSVDEATPVEVTPLEARPAEQSADEHGFKEQTTDEP